MRGQRSLFNDYVTSDITAPPANGYGRNKTLYERQDLKLCYRYFYYTQLVRRNYPDTLLILSMEFDLSAIRIAERLQLQVDTLDRIKHVEKPNRKKLAELYPWLNWEE